MSLGSHQKTIGNTQTWITPKWIIDVLGPFDLDPCAAYHQPWPCAAQGFTEGGLQRPWFGRVWLNPPFHRYEVVNWVQKMAQHRDGIALLHARIEAEWFEPVWEKANGILFLADRLYFHYPNGLRAKANSGAPACLIAFGDDNLDCLRNSKIAGSLVTSWSVQ